MQAAGIMNPFYQQDMVVITSLYFAKNKAIELRRVNWDLIIFDEAHRLRNVYKKSNKIARALRSATGGFPKLLLTATPLQNSLMELYGLISFIDPHIFGDEISFRKQFSRGTKELSQADFIDLKQRISPVTHRTLRRQVTEYVKYTQRIPITQKFMPTNEEWELYEKVSSYLQRDLLFALPKSQRSLMTLVIRKILASSTFALTDTLQSLIKSLDELLIGKIQDNRLNNEEIIYQDIDELDDTIEEWNEEEIEIDELTEEEIINLILSEKRELESYYELARSITKNSKGGALLLALDEGFNKMRELGANEKAVIFTESRRTQRYLKEMLTEKGYNVVMFNGQNSDSDAKRIYEWWIEKHQYDDKITGSKTADMRAALVEYFREHADIMVATESASEGINLQFCSLVVNYDLPWNPQRIEQRIGRCHRYGQKYDVVVINFLNQKNAADQRVYDLLSEKFKLFEGLFGSSDEILGSLESGVDFEKRIQEIYQNCRTAEEIDDAFNRLQEELDEQIRIKMQDTRISLMENFDDEVREKLRDNFEQTTIQLNKLERFLWNLSKIEGQREAVFDDNSLTFIIDKKKYQLMSQIKKEESTNNVVHYRLSHPLAEKWVKQAKGRVLIPKEVTFRYCDYQGKISVIESLVGTDGWLYLDLLNVESVETEQYLIFSAVDNSGNQIDQDICEKLFLLPAIEHEEIEIPNLNNTLQYIKECQVEAVLNSIMERTAEYMDSELEKLDRWAKDLKLKLEAEIDELSVEIDYLKKESKSIRNLQEKLGMNKKIKELEKKRNDMRRNLYDQQDKIDEQKDLLFEEIEAKLQQKVTNKHLFALKWRII